jgi:hypothetical protein
MAYGGTQLERNSRRGVQVNIGEQRRTIYLEPIEEPDAPPVKEPSPAIQPQPGSPGREAELEPAR